MAMGYSTGCAIAAMTGSVSLYAFDLLQVRRGRQLGRPLNGRSWKKWDVAYFTASTMYRRVVLTALSRSGARSFQAFDL
jgi:hypothetical protein